MKRFSLYLCELCTIPYRALQTPANDDICVSDDNDNDDDDDDDDDDGDDDDGLRGRRTSSGAARRQRIMLDVANQPSVCCDLLRPTSSNLILPAHTDSCSTADDCTQ